MHYTYPIKRFYIIASLLLIAGWLWLLQSSLGVEGFTVCLFKNVSGLPCPACGSTGALMLLAQGDLLVAWMLNPLSYLLAVGMVVLPLWVLFDLFTGRVSLYDFVLRFDARVRRQPLLLVVILLPVVVNWVWSVVKMLP